MKYIIFGLGVCVCIVIGAVVYGVSGQEGNESTNKVSSGTISKEQFVSEWSAAKSTGARLIDVRTPGEYEAGHYDGAEMIDFYADDFTEQINALDKDSVYFIYCQSGNRSGQALRKMQALKFTKVYDLAGGIGGNGNILPIVR